MPAGRACEAPMKQLCGPTVALTVIILVAGAARAQQNAQLEPDAMAALRNMGGHLRSLKAFQVDAVTTKEDVLEDGQKVTFGGVTNLLARVPDRLRISVDSDRKKRLYVYDGKTFTMFARRVNYYATVPAPPTIGQLADMIDEKFDMQLPLATAAECGARRARVSPGTCTGTWT